MEKERRYAVIIGVNDYDVNPLEYCVNDAVELKQKLLEKCRYEEKDIFLITSDKNNSNKEITGKYIESIRKIKESFEIDKDSILFYFAGHGSYIQEKSNVFFHGSGYPINEIFKDISEMRPKIQLYIIDSCHSGGKVLTRQINELNDNILEKYIENSSGSMLLYACQTNEFAREEGEKQHGLLTYHLLKALEKEDLYDEDGALTPSRIQEYVLKETSKSSDFQQIPVVENRIAGYYPFAFLNEITELIVQEDIDDVKQILNRNQMSYDRESRLNLQNHIFKIVDTSVIATIEEYKTRYDIIVYDDINDMKFQGSESLIENLVNDSIKNNIEPLKKIYNNNKKYNSKYNALAISFNSLFKTFEGDVKDIPKYVTEYKINSFDEYFESKFHILMSDNIRRVSFGVGLIIYQAKWGIVLTTLSFTIDWDGERDDIITNIEKRNYQFLIEEDSFKIIDNLVSTEFVHIANKVEEWNKLRENELNSFIKSVTNNKLKNLPSAEIN